MARFAATVAFALVPLLALASPAHSHTYKKHKSEPEALLNVLREQKVNEENEHRTICTSGICNILGNHLHDSTTHKGGVNPCKDWEQYVCGTFDKFVKDDYAPHKHSLEVTQMSVIKDKVGMAFDEGYDNTFSYMEKMPVPIPKPTGKNSDTITRFRGYHWDCNRLTHDTRYRPGYRSHDLVLNLTLGAFQQYEAHWMADGTHDPVPFINTTDKIDATDHDMLHNATGTLSKYGIWVFARFRPQQSLFNSSKMVVAVEPYLSTGLPYRALYHDEGIVRHYTEVIELVLTRLTNFSWRYQSWKKIAADVFNLERQITLLAPSLEEWRSFQHWARATPAQLEEAIPELGLASIIASQATEGGATPPDELDILAPRFWSKLSDLLRQESRSTVRAYFLWQAWLQSREGMDNDIDAKHGSLLKKIWGNNQYGSRKMFCKDRQLEYIPEIVGNLFVNTSLNWPRERAMKVGEVIFNDIKTQYINLFEETPWLSKEGKQVLIDKALRLTPMFGFQKKDPDYSSQDEVREVYEGVKVEGKRWRFFNQYLWTHLDDHMKLQAFRANKTWEKLTKPPNKERWSVNPWELRPVYDPQLNKMMLPLALHWKNLIDFRAPGYFSYASYGTLIAQEMSKAFDDVGVNFSPNGTFDEWLPDEDLKRYNEQAQCFLDKYDGMKVTWKNPQKWKKPGLWDSPLDMLKKGPMRKEYQLKGRLVLNNIIGDTQGTELAYRAWKARQGNRTEPALPGFGHLSNDQLFFVIRSTFHCTKDQAFQKMAFDINLGPDAPANVRVGHPLRDLESWNEAFQCKAPEKMCRVYGKERAIERKIVRWDPNYYAVNVPEDDVQQKMILEKEVKEFKKVIKDTRGKVEQEAKEKEQKEKKGKEKRGIVENGLDMGGDYDGDDSNDLLGAQKLELDKTAARAEKRAEQISNPFETDNYNPILSREGYLSGKANDKAEGSPGGAKPWMFPGETEARKDNNNNNNPGKSPGQIQEEGAMKEELDRERWLAEMEEEKKQIARERKKSKKPNDRSGGWHPWVLQEREKMEKQGHHIWGH
ncbi:hypothetical protein ACJ41O_004615 [Fusarium nematophilum]